MPSKIVVAALLGAAIQANAQTECSAGNKLKKKLKGLECKYATEDETSCDTDCCEADTATCGGLTVACGVGEFKHITGSTEAAKKATKVWAATAATKADASTVCCTAQATCGSAAYTCKAGFKPTKKPGDSDYKTWLPTKCSEDAASCATTCCQVDDFTCGGYESTKPGQACPAGQQKGSDDAWKKIMIKDTSSNGLIEAAEFTASCCAVTATCDSKLISCGAGQKKQTSGSCSTLDVSKCSACCVTDSNKCKAQTPACPAGTYKAASLDDVKADASNAAAKCCAPLATCKLAVCPAGQKRKANTDKLFCSGDASTCATSTCCEKDTKKCGGLATALSCPTGFYDESANNWANLKGANAAATAKLIQAASDAWKNKPATAATQNKDCCTKKATCKAAELGTTTPAPTTTPVAPALKFSEHRAAVSNESSSKLVWLTVGGFIGMSVLMVFQRLRASRVTEVEFSESDVE